MKTGKNTCMAQKRVYIAKWNQWIGINHRYCQMNQDKENCSINEH